MDEFKPSDDYQCIDINAKPQNLLLWYLFGFTLVTLTFVLLFCQGAQNAVNSVCDFNNRAMR